MYQTHQKAVLVGVSSFGKKCDGAEGGKFPGVYARVSNQIDWILGNSDAAYCESCE